MLTVEGRTRLQRRRDGYVRIAEIALVDIFAVPAPLWVDDDAEESDHNSTALSVFLTTVSFDCDGTRYLGICLTAPVTRLA
jgi:hypothetical protein